MIRRTFFPAHALTVLSVAGLCAFFAPASASAAPRALRPAAKAPEAPRPGRPPTASRMPVNLPRAPSSVATHKTFSPVIPAGMRCAEQPPQAFLIRNNWFHPPAKTGDKAMDDKSGAELAQQAIRYRTEKYGYFNGFGRPEWNAHTPGQSAVTTTFFGLSIQVHERMAPALACVEHALRQAGLDSAYHPHGIGGIRFHNTYRGGEVSNHVYGIAIDIDSDVNTCCGCMGNWNQAPACHRKSSSVWDRTALPKTWVETFEKFGFYWLGHDPMQDTMHFEFLGDPDKILVRADASDVVAHPPAETFRPLPRFEPRVATPAPATVPAAPALVNAAPTPLPTPMLAPTDEKGPASR